MADGQVGSVRAICHVRCMLDAGCDGAVLLGTTGEGPAFSTGDRKALLEKLLGAIARCSCRRSISARRRHRGIAGTGVPGDR